MTKVLKYAIIVEEIRKGDINLKGKFITAAIIAATVLLSGCSEKSGTSGGSLLSSASQSSEQSTQSTHSSKSGAPTVIAPNFQGSSWQSSETTSYSTEQTSSGTVPEIPVVSSSTPGEASSAPVPSTPDIPNGVSEDILVAKDDTLMMDGHLDISNDFKCVVDGDLIITDGGSVTVGDEGWLYVSGRIEISDDGELVISEGGHLVMEDDDAVIEGGSITLHTDFDSLYCERGTINSQIIPPERKVVDGVTTVGGVVIANKAITLPPEFGSHLSLDEVEPQVYEALVEMNKATDHQYINKSGYRSYWDQKAIFQNYVDLYGYEEADTFSSHAGHSEHQTGLTMDLDSFSESYGYTPAGIWLAENCWRYGFIIRYPKGKEDITGYTYEPWHVRYLGISTAKLVYNSGLTLEEFLNVEGGTTVID